MNSFTSTPETNTQLQLRLYLGAVSGLAIAWFVNPDTAPSIAKSIAPFALAFLGGYSVEIIFSAMDNLINAFSPNKRDSTESEKAKAPASP